MATLGNSLAGGGGEVGVGAVRVGPGKKGGRRKRKRGGNGGTKTTQLRLALESQDELINQSLDDDPRPNSVL